MSRFLAEDFRNLLDTIDRISEDKPEKSKLIDIDDLLVDDRPEGIEKNSVDSIKDLINYLDQYPELSDYRNQNAKFDDAVYENLPLDTLSIASDINQTELEKIANEAEPDTGFINIENGTVSIFGHDFNV